MKQTHSAPLALALMTMATAAMADTALTLPPVKVTAPALRNSALGGLTKQPATGALTTSSVLDTPFSVTVVSSEDMLERGARSIGQIFANDAAVYTPTSSFTTDWWGTQIRGLPVRNGYVDDIPMLLHWGGDFPTEVVESVTALKGLTGFMYGFGEPGGALSYQLKRPKKTHDTQVHLGWRNPSLLSAHVDTSRPLSDTLGLRANLATEQGTAYNASEIRRTVGSVALEQRFSPALNGLATLVYENSRNAAEPLQLYFSDYDVEGSGGRLPPVTYDYGRANVDSSYYHTETLLATTTLQWQIDTRWQLKLQAGLSRKDHRSNKAFADLLNIAGDYRGYSYNFAGQLDTRFTQAMLQGSVELGTTTHRLVAGLGQQRSLDKWGSDWYWENDFNGNLYQEQTFRNTRTPDFSLTPVSADTLQSYAFFSDTVQIGPRWQAIAGLRATRYRLKDLDGDPGVDSGYSTRQASPTLALIYKPDLHTSLYGSYVEGLEPGTRVAPPYANAGQLLGATVSKQVELGAKHASRGVDYTAALFRVERANQIDQLRDGERTLTQDGRLVYQGLELAGGFQLSKALNLGLAAVYLDARINKVAADNAAIEGNAPSYAPKWQVVVNAQYRVPGVHGLKLQGNARYFGRAYTSDQNTLAIPSRTVVNAGFSHEFRLQGQDLTVIGNVSNLFNKKYWAGGGWSAGNLGEARNVALSLLARF